MSCCVIAYYTSWLVITLCLCVTVSCLPTYKSDSKTEKINVADQIVAKYLQRLSENYFKTVGDYLATISKASSDEVSKQPNDPWNEEENVSVTPNVEIDECLMYHNDVCVLFASYGQSEDSITKRQKNKEELEGLWGRKRTGIRVSKS